MEPIDAGDAAIGWAIIATIALAGCFGIPMLIAFLARNIGAALEQRRRERERIQDDLDELARLEMLAFLQREDREREGHADGTSAGSNSPSV